MSSKKELGQFYTTNYEYIMTGINMKKELSIIEPFVGKGHLLQLLNKSCNIEMYDIDPKIPEGIILDTLLNPPSYNNKFVLTNPPYLARNKSGDKKIFDKYKQNDLYKCFLQSIINDNPLGGAIIIPINFWCSVRASDLKLRKMFLKSFNIVRVNIFSERVFDDTSSCVCVVHFYKRMKKDKEGIDFCFFPSKRRINIVLNEENMYTIGGELFKLKTDKSIKVDRLTRNNKDGEGVTNIYLKCIDDNNKISLSIKKKRYCDETKNLSARSFATLVINPPISDERQIKLIYEFNTFLNEYREKYNSLFLTSFREMKRKRISFSFAYKIINYLLSSEDYIVIDLI